MLVLCQRYLHQAIHRRVVHHQRIAQQYVGHRFVLQSFVRAYMAAAYVIGAAITDGPNAGLVPVTVQAQALKVFDDVFACGIDGHLHRMPLNFSCILFIQAALSLPLITARFSSMLTMFSSTICATRNTCSQSNTHAATSFL